MKATDVFTLEITGREAAKIYAIMGKANGPTGDEVWGKVMKLLGDESREKYDLIIHNQSRADALNYHNYYRAWETALFTPKKTEAEIELDSLQSQIDALQEQMNRVKVAVANEEK